PALVRCVELHRAAYTCFDNSQNSWREYWTTYLALFGAVALAERLLFDGRATVAPSDGLYACSLIDDAGGTAPWREYLALYDAGGHETSYSENPFDPKGVLNLAEEESLIAVQ